MIDTPPKLTPKQRRFVEAFTACGNASKAAEAAGYRLPRSQGSRLLTNVDIINAIDERSQAMEEESIATSQERQQFWSAVMRDPSQSPRDRLKASELLGKAQGDFIIRHELAEPAKLVIYLPDNRRDLPQTTIACIDSPAQLGG